MKSFHSKLKSVLLARAKQISVIMDSHGELANESDEDLDSETGLEDEDIGDTDGDGVFYWRDFRMNVETFKKLDEKLPRSIACENKGWLIKVDFKIGYIGIRMVPSGAHAAVVNCFSADLVNWANNNANAPLIDVLDVTGDGSIIVFAAVLIISRLSVRSREN
jgi:hypothetical protein